jgi:hypothetical protein
MSLITNKTLPVFDLAAIRQGDNIRVRRATDTAARNGIVTRLDERQIQILFANVQNNATGFMTVDAADVAIGVWEIWWTTDFVTINYNPPAGA